MLYIKRKKNESIVIDGVIEIIVSHIESGQVKLGFQLLSDTKPTILRKELFDKIKSENETAVQISPEAAALLFSAEEN
ncbi:MAG: carbon storage regulator [Alphaproteobacteria bacterium]|nr:carbon storage regulator [Alphaproteobacteria bacterium]MBP9877810.1 carbon storage regulator [Alphaproteobacteria bacterium]